jgi:para-aminobenzoate synthetase/4-amino-4-deoxychorismate lyase
MTSTIQAQIDSQLRFSTIIEALFPCGSITGAPKRRTMEIIQDLEAEPRGIYTGALGYLSPSKDFVFSIAIRTAVLNEAGPIKTGEMGIGSGVVYYSDIQKEWDECHLKSKFLKSINSAFGLIETLHYSAKSQVVSRLELHLVRLGRSARVFGFQFDEKSIRSQLKEFLQKPLQFESKEKLNPSSNHRIRLLLTFDGHLDISSQPIESIESYDKIMVCSKPILKTQVHQQHKTTFRKTYDEAFQRAQAFGFDEVLFLNEDGNCAEASRHNLIIKKNGKYWTPPVSDGALPGIYRQALLEDPIFDLIEKTFDLETLLSAEAIYLCNSVRGLVPVREISKKYLL